MNTTPVRCGLLALAAISSPSYSQITGEWRETAQDAVQYASDKCISIWLSERRLVLNPMPDGSLAGFYMRRDLGQWLHRNDSTCRLPGTHGSQQFFQRLRKWTATAAPAGSNRWTIRTQYQGCSFLGCDDAASMFTGNFDITVELRGSRLAEVGGSGYLFTYRRAAEADSMNRAAESAFKTAVADFDAGNCLRFYGQNFVAGAINPQVTAQLCQNYEQLRGALPPITSTDIAYSNPLDAVMIGQQYQPLDDVILLGFVNRTDGSAMPRGAIMHRDGDRWLIRRMLTP